jgi:hypothetical protein
LSFSGARGMGRGTKVPGMCGTAKGDGKKKRQPGNDESLPSGSHPSACLRGDRSGHRVESSRPQRSARSATGCQCKWALDVYGGGRHGADRDVGLGVQKGSAGAVQETAHQAPAAFGCPVPEETSI